MTRDTEGRTVITNTSGGDGPSAVDRQARATVRVHFAEASAPADRTSSPSIGVAGRRRLLVRGDEGCSERRSNGKPHGDELSARRLIARSAVGGSAVARRCCRPPRAGWPTTSPTRSSTRTTPRRCARRLRPIWCCIDGLIADDPDNTDVLLAGAELYSSYAAAFVEDPERAKRLPSRAGTMAGEACAAATRTMCDSWTAPYDQFEAAVASLGAEDVAGAFTCRRRRGRPGSGPTGTTGRRWPTRRGSTP